MNLKKLTLGRAAAGTLFSIQAAQADGKVLRVGTEPTFPPFEFTLPGEQTITGFDIDLITEIAKAEGYEVEIQSVPFDGLIPALMTGVIDAAASAITITEERQKRIAFSEPYYTSGLTALIRASDQDQIKTIADLKGKIIGTQIGTTGSMFAAEIENATTKNFNTLPEAYMELKANGCDAVINDRPVNDYFLATSNSDGVVSLSEVYSAEDYGIAMRLGNDEVITIINDGFAKIKANGVYDTVYAKWFGVKK